MKKNLFLISLYFLFNLTLTAQVVLPGTYMTDLEYIDFLQSDSSSYDEINTPVKYDSGNYFDILDPYLSFSVNTKYPRTYNDGPIWKGKGFTQELHAGFQAKQGLLHFTLYPAFFFSQNAAFPLASVNVRQNPLNYQFGVGRSVDYVQRFGTNSFARVHWGQSEIALKSRFLMAAISTQNFTMGPSRHNHIIMSNSGPGFPHLKIGTPGSIPISRKQDFGRIDANIFYGLLTESAYFDSIPENDHRYINGLSFSYQLPAITGIRVGFGRTLYKSTEHFSNKDLYSMFFISDQGVVLSNQGDTLINTNDLFDQLASAFIEWQVPNNDLRLHFEFARNDFNGSLRRIITEFEHSRGYSLGLSKIIHLKDDKLLLVEYEHTFLPRFISFLYRANPTFYTHHVVRQGYSNDGQILGAGIGPGAATDFLEVTHVNGENLFGVNLQRIRFDEDYFNSSIPNNRDKIDKHDIEYTLGIKYSKRISRFYLGVESLFSYRYNMYYIPRNDMFNWNGNIFASYRIR